MEKYLLIVGRTGKDNSYKKSRIITEKDIEGYLDELNKTIKDYWGGEGI